METAFYESSFEGCKKNSIRQPRQTNKLTLLNRFLVLRQVAVAQAPQLLPHLLPLSILL